MIDIKDISGKTRFSTAINKGAKGKFTLMKEDYIILPFSVPSPIPFKLGDYVDLAGVLDESLGGKLAKIYEITDIQKPTYNTSTGGYDYELKMNAYYWKWKNKIFKYTPEHAGSEASWSLTAALDIQLGVFLRNLKALGYTYRGTDFTFSIDDTVENKAVAMTYDNMNLLDALFSMAGEDKWNCDCWITDNVIHFGRNEFGDAVKIERGVEASSVTRSESQGTYATRIYAFGSTKNIPTNYRPTDEQAVINGVVQKRLMLPADTPYIDAYEGMSQEEAIEDVVVFDYIYPRRVGTLSDVHTRTEDVNNEDGTTETVTYYRYKDTGLEFKEEYILEGQELKIKFQSGKLNGMEFGVIFNPEPKDEARGEQLWEIVRNEDYGRPLPDDIIRPENGDKYILSGFDIQMVSDQYIPAAEQELKEEAQKYADKVKKDDGTYPTTLRSDWVYEDPVSRTFEFGQRINLVDDTYFDSGRISRVLGWELNLDIPWDSPIYTIGESMPYSRIGEIEDKVDSLTYKGQTYTGGSGGVYLIRVNDTTAPSDSNAFSALRSVSSFHPKGGSAELDFASKNLNVVETATTLNAIVQRLATIYDLDVTHVATLFNTVIKNQLSSENYISGLTGEGMKLWQAINGDWNLEIDNVTIRKAFYVFEMVVQKVRSVNGALAITQGNGNIKTVSETTGDPAYYVCEIEGDMTFEVGDFVRCQVFSASRLKYYWVKVYQVTGNSIYLLKSDFSTDIPEAGDEIVQIGNDTNPNRQSVLYLSASEDGKPRFSVLDGVNSPSFVGKTKAVLGYIGDIIDSSFPAEHQPSGYGLYCQNAFLSGVFVLSNGKSVEDEIGSINSQIIAIPGLISSSVTEEVSKIEIGGRNHLLNSSLSSKMDWNQNGASPQFVTLEGVPCMRIVAGTGGAASGIYRSIPYGLKTANTITFSIDVYVTAVGGYMFFGVESYGADDAKIAYTFKDSDVGKWIRISVTGIPQNKNIVIYTYGNTQPVYYKNVKGEIGTKATDWSPAPEDIQDELDNKVAVTVYESGITQLQSSINSKVSQTDFNALGNRVSAVETEIVQTPNKITQAIKETSIGGDNLLPNLQQRWARGRFNSSTGAIEVPSGTGWSYIRINIYCAEFFPVNGGETLVFSAPTDHSYTCFPAQYDASKTFIPVAPELYYMRNYYDENQPDNLKFLTLKPQTRYVRWQIQCSYGGETGDFYPSWFETNHAQVEIGTKPSAYKTPFTDVTYTGIDVQQGKIWLTADKVEITGELIAKGISTGGINVGGNCIITSTGLITAKGATIEGKITATSGSIGGVSISNSRIGIDSSSTSAVGSFLAAEYLGVRNRANYFRVDANTGALQCTIDKTTDTTPALSIRNATTSSGANQAMAIRSVGRSEFYGGVQVISGSSVITDDSVPKIEVTSSDLKVTLRVNNTGTYITGYLRITSSPATGGNATVEFVRD